MKISAHALLLGALAVFCTASAVRADENYFGYTYGSDTLPKGRSEIYQWITSRTGKADGSYSALDLQTEIEHGFTDRLQGSLYLNGISHDISGVTGFTDRNRTNFNGLQGSLKYNLQSVDRGGWGVSVYLEPGYKRYSASSGDRTDIYFLEPKLILQKNYLDDTLVWATNIGSEFEREHDLVADAWESELELQISTGLSYRFAPGWFAGLEALATSAFEKMHLDEMGEYAIFAGPNIHYATANWWATLTVLPQLTGWPENKGARNLDNYESLQVRLKIGYDF
ncbi:MAG TPA: DUF6662 family protein [Rariglobus sp.]|nr:DUF6662 family protein [Rariglobus sp.]